LNAKNFEKKYGFSTIFDGEEIQVPKSIQDLIEKNIRTMSNSLSTAKSGN